MDGHRSAPAATLLAVVYLVGGALCFAGAASPMAPETPVDLLWGLGVAGVGIGAALLAFGQRLPSWALHAALALVSVLVGVLAWRSATPVGIVGLGPAMTAVALYAAHVLPLPSARAHTAFVVAAASAGAAAAEPSGFLNAWLALSVTVLVLAEAQGRLARRLREAADTDPLTGVANRRSWEVDASRHLAGALRTGDPLSVAILDLDDFKQVNDRDGHGAGDALLRELTASWAQRLRSADLLGRYGGDEFVLCLPATDERGAQELLARLEESHDFRWSVGLATVRPGDTLTGVLARADEDLYQRKRAGRQTR
ncbi:diguanylate cyclase (GGDEF) domain-containing protein [Blastococcus aurantiacus]|uniref:Diguanylate cyclase (GGDEF) domain-containing protein n=1 Tax=Blastococcus aurantiacus TaxID=1550231 RepID=A0A1G7I7I7_9ACTN|nr:GGDEF domain-containing protein [Blastococcus aurantiacus]SDF08506.1 diguanylate cyclase (GGDEF) domain-containing protein [Blastococcus aurantiacus]